MPDEKRRWFGLFRRRPRKAEEQQVPQAPQVSPGKDLRDRITQRINSITESILENEGLTADLEDSAAKTLIQWGTDIAKMIADGTGDLEDDEAETAMYPRLRAMRRMMRYINTWVAERFDMNLEDKDKLLAKIIDQASVLYGRQFDDLDAERRAAFEHKYADVTHKADYDAPQVIAALRALFEAGQESENA